MIVEAWRCGKELRSKNRSNRPPLAGSGYFDNQSLDKDRLGIALSAIMILLNSQTVNTDSCELYGFCDLSTRSVRIPPNSA